MPVPTPYLTLSQCRHVGDALANSDLFEILLLFQRHTIRSPWLYIVAFFNSSAVLPISVPDFLPLPLESIHCARHLRHMVEFSACDSLTVQHRLPISESLILMVLIIE